MIVLIMSLGTYHSLLAQQQLVLTYQLQIKPTQLDLNQHQFERTKESYNASLQQFPTSLVAKICNFKSL